MREFLDVVAVSVGSVSAFPLAKGHSGHFRLLVILFLKSICIQTVFVWNDSILGQGVSAGQHGIKVG